MKKLLITLIAALLTASPSYAAIVMFDITGVTDITGTVTIDTVSGSVTKADLVYSGTTSPPDYTNIVGQGKDPIFGGYDLDVANATTSFADALFLNLASGSLVGYAGGSYSGNFESNCTIPALDCNGGPGLPPFATLQNGTLTPAATPLPAALPLFAAGIGALGLLGWRRKRKAQVL